MRHVVAKEIAELVEARLAEEEFARRLAVPLAPEEIADTLALVRWFTTRYPTVRERFDYARRTFEAATSAPRLRPRPTRT